MFYYWLIFFEKFRNNSLKSYGICPSHYLSAQTLRWDAMLDMKVELETISDAEVYFFFEKGMRGGVSNISNKANNNYLSSYGSKQESKHIIYLDANNSYGYAVPNLF